VFLQVRFKYYLPETRILVMSEIIKYEDVEKRVMTLQGQQVLIDSDVAELYGIETKRVNEAVTNNPDKFPEGYIISLSSEEWINLKSKFSTSSWGGKNKLPKAFTEKGLYMLATILKSPTATQTTLAIVETFAKIREFARIVSVLPDIKEEQKANALMQKGGDMFIDLLEDNMLEISGDEISFELDLKIMKLKRVIKRESKK